MVELNYKVKHIKKHFSTRPGIKLLRLQALVDHWTANFGATAQGHFKYFNETLPDQNDRERIEAAHEGREEKIRYASAHIFVDKNEAIELVPLDEVCFHANDRTLKLSSLRATSKQYPGGNANLLTIGVEMCVEKNGTIHPDTIERARLVIKMLQDKFSQLRDTRNRVVRHFDVTGKPCPLPFVEDQQKWNAFLHSIDQPVKGDVTIANQEESKMNDEGEETMKPSNDTISNSVAVVLKRLESKENGISAKWREDFLNGKLSTSDAIGLIYVALDRALIQGEK
ncbi:N-acetylmuramoyl-L-alanine amidase [Bacillus sp. MCCB 382]|uniref:peptidoglycan recognition protein family protein n=1 Tax=Bacillus sp. MCCB 382 TaxID=2860197 RepID=UPI001C599C98|nr:N-acetylmuramoyl-L-alanine amidase [Bacillus sp. MCCB 382]